MAQACLTFASQNHAVGREKRCTAVFRDSILLGLLLTFSAGMVFYFGRTMFLGFYTKDAVVLAFAVSKMRHSMVTQFLEVPFDMPGSMLRSYDHPLAPAVITVIGTCVFRLGWVFLVFPHDRDYVEPEAPRVWKNAGRERKSHSSIMTKTDGRQSCLLFFLPGYLFLKWSAPARCP